MLTSKPDKTPMAPHLRLIPNEGTQLSDPYLYCSLVGSLHYLTFARPDLSFPVHQVCWFTSCPTDVHLVATKRILRYLNGTSEFAVFFNLVLFFSLPALILTGLVTLIIVFPLMGSWSTLVTVQSHGVQRNNSLSLTPLLNLNILLLNYAGFVNSRKIYAASFPYHLSSGVTMSQPWLLHLI